MLQIALHDGVTDSRINSCGNHFRVTVAVSVNTNPRDQVQLDAPIGQFHKWTIADSAAQIREIEGTTSQTAEFIQNPGILRRQFRIGRANIRQLRTVVSHRGQDQPLGLGQPRIRVQLVSQQGWEL